MGGESDPLSGMGWVGGGSPPPPRAKEPRPSHPAGDPYWTGSCFPLRTFLRPKGQLTAGLGAGTDRKWKGQKSYFLNDPDGWADVQGSPNPTLPPTCPIFGKPPPCFLRLLPVDLPLNALGRGWLASLPLPSVSCSGCGARLVHTSTRTGRGWPCPHGPHRPAAAGPAFPRPDAAHLRGPPRVGVRRHAGVRRAPGAVPYLSCLCCLRGRMAAGSVVKNISRSVMLGVFPNSNPNS